MDVERVSPRPEQPVRLALSMQTCDGCPSQWDATAVDGSQLYMRYRHGRGSVEVVSEGGVLGPGAELIASWYDGTNDGIIGLDEFCALANLMPPRPVMRFRRAYLDG